MNNELSCIAIDDEQSALDIITEFCTRIRYLNLVGTYTNPFDAVRTLNKTHIDLIFLDIQMPEISGFEFLKSLYNPPMIIFTSVDRENAFESFEYDAVDYLVKPFQFERFTRSVNKAFHLLRLRQPEDTSVRTDTGILQHGFLMVKVEYSTIRVNLSDILYIEGLKDYVKIFTEGRLVLTKTTMKNILEKLPPEYFFRVHKSYIISVDKIDMIENSRIVIGNQRIPIGESYRSSFFSMVGRNLI